MNLKTKKIIAREGLIISGIIALGVLFFYLGYLLNIRYLKNIDGAEIIPYLFGYTLVDGILIKSIGLHITILGYPFYLLIRFIIWSMRTLKKREE